MNLPTFLLISCFLLLLRGGPVHAGEPLRVACVGDSITYGFGIENRGKQSYPAQLQGLLGDRWIVGNFGKNGATVLKKGHAPYWKAPQYKAAQKFMPDVVIIKLGTNDTRPQNIGAHKSEFVADYVNLIRSFQNLESKPEVWICYPVPIYEQLKGMTNTVLISEIIPLVSEVARQAGVEFIDLNTALSDQAELFPDGIHPNAEGAGVIAKTVAAVFNKESSVSKAADERPNFIIILTDDQGYQDLGCYGSPDIRTPRIDRMAEEGMKFTSFYAQTVCGPTRASLLTGSYPMRVERAVHDNGLIPHPAMSLNEVTLAEILKDRGYKTGMAGKWDLSGRRTRGAPTFKVELGPFNQGFDVTFWGETSSCKPIRDGDKIVLKNPLHPSPTELFTNKAIEFIEANRGEAFFFYLAHPMPHVPLLSTPRFKKQSKAGLYGAVIEELDFHTGRLLDKVKELGLDENTYIIFTSDNGPWLRYGKNSGHAEPLRSGKTSTYEGGLRVPFIIRAPGKVPAGTTNDLVTATIDLMPTIAKLAGAEVPSDRVIDGLDISEIFHGTQTELDRPYFFYQHQSLRAVRQGDWKLHLPHSELDKTKEGALWQTHVPSGDRPYIEELTLYNLKDDIGETTNVAKAHPEIVQQLMQQLDFAQQAIGYHDVIGKNSRLKAHQP